MKIEFENPSFQVRWLMFRRSLDIRVFFKDRIVIDFNEQQSELCRRILQAKTNKNSNVHKPFIDNEKKL